ncbi:hypothetical protein G3RUM_00440 [Candidatus Nanosyncoccus alces]|uniref:Uncharacterized protein n=1 Tax=Candidatus Nanosyncoccus alces TaxID=2171997 RepID=A0ABY0FN82_9BACT|nr:hypothetical protein G3RUM_00440 [Candidatus Nanosyncoccus alces]
MLKNIIFVKYTVVVYTKFLSALQKNNVQKSGLNLIVLTKISYKLHFF